jgi:curli biogenesis system outer membrane secretion channel CsgG
MNALMRLMLLPALMCVPLTAGCDGGNVRAGDAPPPPAAGASAPVRTYDYSHKTLQTAKTAAGRKWAVAILRFGDTKDVEGVPFGAASQPAVQQAGEVNVNVEVGARAPAAPAETPPTFNKRARELLKSSLIKSEAFTVIERERILEILREINFGKTRYTDAAGAADEGNLMAVRYILEGSMGPNEDRTLKDNLDKESDYRNLAQNQPGLWSNIFERGKGNREQMAMAIRNAQTQRLKDAQRRQFDVACYISAYEVRTGEVVTTVMGLGTNGLEAIDDAVEELVYELSKVKSDIRVAAVSGETVYLDMGAGSGVKVGGRYQIVHLGKEIRDADGQVIGHEEAETGEVEVTEVKPLMSVAKIVQKAGEIQRYDIARPAKH